MPTCDLFEGIFEAQNFDAFTTKCVGLASVREFNKPLKYRRPGHSRKISLVVDKQLENIKETRIPKNTKSNTNWVVGVWHDWARERNVRIKELGFNDILVRPNVVKTTVEELRCWFAKFVVEVHKKGDKGEHYPPTTLYQLCFGLLRFLRNNGRPALNKFEDPRFKHFQDTLDAMTRCWCKCSASGSIFRRSRRTFVEFKSSRGPFSKHVAQHDGVLTWQEFLSQKRKRTSPFEVQSTYIGAYMWR